MTPRFDRSRLSQDKLTKIRERLEREGLAADAVERIRPREDDGPAPLTFSQERLWFLDRMAPNSPVFNIPAAYRLKGPVDANRLERALERVSKRHAALRTRFVQVDGRPAQSVVPEARIDFAAVEVGSGAKSAREARAVEFARAAAREPFDLTRAPLARVRLLQIAEQEHLLLVCLHHVVGEVQSLGLLVRDLADLYRAIGEDPAAELPQLEVQFADFAAWQRARVSGDRYEEQLDYWKQRLGGTLPTLELFTDRPRHAVQTFAGGTRTRTLPHDLTTGLREFCQAEGVTLFMATAAAWAALLARYTSQEDVLIGIPMTDRNRAEIQSVIGLFVNTLVLRNDLSGDPSFRELLRRTRETVLGAQANQELPFEHIVEALQPDRDLSRSPIFQVAFLFQNASEAGEQVLEFGAGTRLVPHEDPLVVHTDTAKFDLALVVWDDGEGLAASFEYNRDLYDGETVERMLAHYECLLGDASRDPERLLSALKLLPAEEERTLLETWNDTAVEFPDDALVHELFERAVDRDPEALAVTCGDRELSYGELDMLASGLAHDLRELGIGPDDRVAILCERTPEMVIGILGTLKAGGAYVPLDLAYPRERLAFMVADAQAEVVLSLREFADALPEHAGRTIFLDEELPRLARSRAGRPERTVASTNLAYLIFTSGSTGKPKGVELEHIGLVNLLSWHRAEYEVGPMDRATHLAGLAFDASVWELWPYLTAGASLHLVEEEVRLAPRRLLEWLTEKRITLSFLATPLAEALLRETLPQGLELRAVLTGGDKLHSAPSELPFRLVNHYGPTENTVVATFCEVKPAEFGDKAPPIGRPISNVQCYVLDSRRALVPIGVPGELYVGGASLARGYHDRPDLTAERFVPNPFGPGLLYATGDLVRTLPDGQLEFLGRIDAQVKVRGFRIELGEIEAVLGAHGALEEAAVAVRSGMSGENVLVAYVVTGAGGMPPEEELRASLRRSLPDYMVPSAFVELEALPLTPNGKVDRRALPEPPEPSAHERFVAPEGEVQQTIATVWGEVLGLEQVSADKNFFELGGHSLLMAQVHGHLTERLAVELSIIELFQYPSVSSLAGFLEDRRQSTGALRESRDRGATRRERMQRRRRIRD